MRLGAFVRRRIPTPRVDRERTDRALIGVVIGYAAVVVTAWLAVVFLTDVTWPATLLGYGPRWVVGLPSIPLGFLVVMRTSAGVASGLIGVLIVTATLLVVGLMDVRLGSTRARGTPSLRLLVQNLGHSDVTAASLDRLLQSERVDIAALQECPFYDNSPARLGWEFYYGGDLCMVSRFPFELLDEADPDNVWRRGGREPLRFAIQTPSVTIQLLNVHFETIRSGLDGFGHGFSSGWRHFAENRLVAALDSRRASARARRVVGPLLVAGDFNLPVESAIYRDSWGTFRNLFSECGRGFGHTKTTPAFGVRIDHVLASEHWTCVAARVLESPYGGDHRPLVVDLRLMETQSPLGS